MTKINYTLASLPSVSSVVVLVSLAFVSVHNKK